MHYFYVQFISSFPTVPESHHQQHSIDSNVIGKINYKKYMLFLYIGNAAHVVC